MREAKLSPVFKWRLGHSAQYRRDDSTLLKCIKPHRCLESLQCVEQAFLAHLEGPASHGPPP